MDPKIFDDIARKLSEAVPSGLKTAKEELEKSFKAILQSAFAKLDLITREEFDVQMKVLTRTRTKMEELEQKIEALEKQHHLEKKKTVLTEKIVK